MSIAKATKEEIEKAAVDVHCDVVVSDDLHLLIDIDSVGSELQFKAMIEVLCNNLDIIRYKIEEWSSKSGGDHKHFYITFSKPLPLVDRLLLQSCLGSDPLKEMLSWIAHRSGKLPNEFKSVLFRPWEEGDGIEKVDRSVTGDEWRDVATQGEDPVSRPSTVPNELTQMGRPAPPIPTPSEILAETARLSREVGRVQDTGPQAPNTMRFRRYSDNLSPDLDNVPTRRRR